MPGGGGAVALAMARAAKHRANMMRCERDDVEWYGAEVPCWICSAPGTLVYQKLKPKVTQPA